MESMHCVNCGQQLNPDFKVCPECGQKTNIHRFNVSHILHELLHAFTHADKGAFRLIKELAVRPGLVLYEYIVEGRRKKYFNPFTLLLLILGFSVFMNSIFHPFEKNGHFIQEKIATANSAAKKAVYQRIAEGQANVNEFMEKKANIVIFITAPIMALSFWLVFKSRRLNFAEHLVAYLMLTCILSLVSTLSFVPLISVVPQKWVFLVVLGNFLIQITYTSYAYTKLLKLKGFREIVLALIANMLGSVLIIMLISILTIIYIILS